jgi:Flp pilus assembly pilin Flp
MKINIQQITKEIQLFRLIQKGVLREERGQVMIEFLLITVFIVIVIYGFEFSFKEILAPAFKRMTAMIRWPIP